MRSAPAWKGADIPSSELDRIEGAHDALAGGRDDERLSSRKKRSTELLSVILLATAGVASGWSGYQAARWGGAQATDYSRAAAIRLESAKASAAADQLRAIDVAMFMNWVNAYAAGNPRLMQFYERRFRPEFQPAFRAWLDSRPDSNPDAAPSPFSLDSYRVAKAAEAELLAREAESVFSRGQQANRWSDAYVFTTVLFAMVLLPRLQVVLLGLGGALLLIGVALELSLPTLLVP